MEEPFDPAAARTHVLAILEGPGVTVFTKRAKEDLLASGMTSVDAVNVLRGGQIAKPAPSGSGWTYRADTRRMSVEFSFRRHGRDTSAAPNELVIESARRNNR
jgi:hypothetical protein